MKNGNQVSCPDSLGITTRNGLTEFNSKSSRVESWNFISEYLTLADTYSWIVHLHNNKHFSYIYLCHVFSCKIQHEIISKNLSISIQKKFVSNMRFRRNKIRKLMEIICLMTYFYSEFQFNVYIILRNGFMCLRTYSFAAVMKNSFHSFAVNSSILTLKENTI